jgi:glycosyltransferase involved in cell wall biosynthesis
MHCPRLYDLPPPPPGKTGWPWTEERPQLPGKMPADWPWPRISIVTPSYNQGAFIEKTIRSVLLQGYPDLEYIIIDGSSTDASVEIIKKYQAHVDFWSSEPDGGPANALNRGFSRSRGEICGYLNSDDFILPGALTRASKAFSDHTGIDVIYGNGYIVDANDNRTRTIYSDNWSLTRYAFGAASVMQQATFFRRSAFDKAKGFNIENHTCWDGELLVDLAIAGARFHRIDDFLGAFRIHNNSISGSGRLEAAYLRDCRRLFNKIMKRNPSTIDRLFMFPAWRLIKHLNNRIYVLTNILNRYYHA